MDSSRAMPMNPWVFCSVYLLLGIGAAIAATSASLSSKWSMYAGLACTTLAIVFQLHWIFRALEYLGAVSSYDQGAIAERIRSVRRSTIIAGAIFGIVVLILVALNPATQNTPIGFLLAVALLSAMGLLLRVFWVAASAMCDEETGTGAPSHSVVGSFLLFWYILLGAPFLYRRLLKLGHKRKAFA